MSTVDCVNCGAAVPTQSRFCPECGHPLHEAGEQSVRRRYWTPPDIPLTIAIVAGVVGVVLLGAQIWLWAAVALIAGRRRPAVPVGGGPPRGRIGALADRSAPRARRGTVARAARAVPPPPGPGRAPGRAQSGLPRARPRNPCRRHGRGGRRARPARRRRRPHPSEGGRDQHARTRSRGARAPRPGAERADPAHGSSTRACPHPRAVPAAGRGRSARARARARALAGSGPGALSGRSCAGARAPSGAADQAPQGIAGPQGLTRLRRARRRTPTGRRGTTRPVRDRKPPVGATQGRPGPCRTRPGG